MADNLLVYSMVARLLGRLRGQGSSVLCPPPAHHFQEGGHRGQKGLPLGALLFSQTLWKFLHLIFPHTSSSVFKLISTYGTCRLFALFLHPASLPELPVSVAWKSSRTAGGLWSVSVRSPSPRLDGAHYLLSHTLAHLVTSLEESVSSPF